jgi:flagellar biogenesis protein FliO
VSAATEYLVQTGVTLLAVVVLAWLVLFAGRRFGVSHTKGPMELLGRLQLEPRRAVCLVKIGDKVLVLGTSEAGVNKLAELTESELPEAAVVAQRSFTEVLHQVMGRKS